MNLREIILDTETTGLDPLSGHRIVEIGCVEMINKIVTGKTYHAYINPKRDVPDVAYKIHGLSTEFLSDKPEFKHIAEEFLDFIEDSQLVIHNAKFDMKFLNAELKSINKSQLNGRSIIDTLDIARRKFPGSPASLDALCRKFEIDNKHRTSHGALLDADLLSRVYVCLTGNAQPTILTADLDKRYKETVEKVVNSKKVFRDPRKFPLTAEEEQAHEDFLNLLKQPMWDSSTNS